MAEMQLPEYLVGVADVPVQAERIRMIGDAVHGVGDVIILSIRLGGGSVVVRQRQKLEISLRDRTERQLGIGRVGVRRTISGYRGNAIVGDCGANPVLIAPDSLEA